MRLRPRILCHYDERHRRLYGVIAGNDDLELVQTTHSLVHAEGVLEPRFLTRLQDRLTDDRLDRSAALQGVNGEVFEHERLIADVLETEVSLHGLSVRNLALVVHYPVNNEPGAARERFRVHQRRLTRHWCCSVPPATPDNGSDCSENDNAAHEHQPAAAEPASLPAFARKLLFPNPMPTCHWSVPLVQRVEPAFIAGDDSDHHCRGSEAWLRIG